MWSTKANVVVFGSYALLLRASRLYRQADGTRCLVRGVSRRERATTMKSFLLRLREKRSVRARTAALRSHKPTRDRLSTCPKPGLSLQTYRNFVRADLICISRRQQISSIGRPQPREISGDPKRDLYRQRQTALQRLTASTHGCVRFTIPISHGSRLDHTRPQTNTLRSNPCRTRRVCSRRETSKTIPCNSKRSGAEPSMSSRSRAC
jgi:hypothetical protein